MKTFITLFLLFIGSLTNLKAQQGSGYYYGPESWDHTRDSDVGYNGMTTYLMFDPQTKEFWDIWVNQARAYAKDPNGYDPTPKTQTETAAKITEQHEEYSKASGHYEINGDVLTLTYNGGSPKTYRMSGGKIDFRGTGLMWKPFQF